MDRHNSFFFFFSLSSSFLLLIHIAHSHSLMFVRFYRKRSCSILCITHFFRLLNFSCFPFLRIFSFLFSVVYKINVRKNKMMMMWWQKSTNKNAALSLSLYFYRPNPEDQKKIKGHHIVNSFVRTNKWANIQAVELRCWNASTTPTPTKTRKFTKSNWFCFWYLDRYRRSLENLNRKWGLSSCYIYVYKNYVIVSELISRIRYTIQSCI